MKPIVKTLLAPAFLLLFFFFCLVFFAGGEAPALPVYRLASRSFTYDGAPHEVGFLSLSAPEGKEGSFLYDWRRDGVTVSREETFSVTRVSDSGEYSCVIGFLSDGGYVEIETAAITVSVAPMTVPFPNVSPKEYTGYPLYPDIAPSPLLSASLTGGTDAGEYPVLLSLTDPENTTFPDGQDSVELSFSVLPARNEWTSPLTVPSCFLGDAPAPSAASSFGTPTYTFSQTQNGDFRKELPDGPGVWYCRAEISAGKNYTALASLPVAFEVKADHPEALSLLSPPSKLIYKAFEPFDPTDMSVSVLYDSGKRETLPLSALSVTTPSEDGFRVGDGYAEVVFCGLSLRVPVRVDPAEYDLSDLSFSEVTVEYDGAYHTLALPDLPVGKDGVPLTASLSGGGTDAGEYVVRLNFSSESENYKIPSSVSARLTISPREVDADFSGIAFTYDGAPHCPLATYTDVFGAERPLAVSGAAADAGVYTAVASLSDPNYALTSASTEYSIARAAVDLSGVFWSESSFVYDGKEKTVSLSGLPAPAFLVGYADATATDAGEYVARAILSVDEKNFLPPAPLTHAYEILPASYDFSGVAFRDATFVYDGDEKRPALSGDLPVGADGSRPAVSFSRGAVHVSEGLVTVVASFRSESGNYLDPPPLAASVSILPASVSVLWSGDAFVYDGGSHLPEAFAEETALSVLGAGIGAGSYTAVASPLSSDYILENPTFPFRVEKRENAWLDPLSIADLFEGEAPAPKVRAAFGAPIFVYRKDGEEVSLPKTPGVYTVSALVPENENYLALASPEVAFRVAAVEPVGLSVSLLCPSLPALSAPGPGDFSAVLLYNNGTRAPLDPSSVSVACDLHPGDGEIAFSYAGFTVREKIAVSKAVYDMKGVKWEGVSLVYNGVPQSPRLSGLPAGVGVLKLSSATLVGKYPLAASLSYDEENYEPPILPAGLFEILPRVVPLPAVFSLVYSGARMLPAVPESPDYRADPSPVLSAGRYAVSLSLTDPLNTRFEGTVEREVRLEFSVLPKEITIALDDLTVDRADEISDFSYSVVAGEVCPGDDLLLTYSVSENAVLASSENPDYLVTVIPGRITYTDRAAEARRNLLLLLSLALIIVFLLLLILFRRRKRLPAALAAGFVPLLSAPIEGLLSVDVSRADFLLTDALAKDLLDRTPKSVTTSGHARGAINLDTLAAAFLPGDVVEINILKERGLLGKDVFRYKVLARGTLDKPLSILANDFSLTAVKMIALTGGSAKKVTSVRKKR